MSRPSYYHIDVKPPAPAPARKPPVNPPKKKAKQTEIRGLKETTFKRHWRECGLPTLKKREGVCEEEVNNVLACYFSEKTAVSEKAREHAAKLCVYLTEDEQVSILQMCGLVALIGTGGVTDDNQLAIINEIVSESCDDVEEEDRIHAVCREVLKRMQQKYSDVVKIKTAASIDPKRAEKATEETRDSMFSRMEYYVELLHKLGLSPWNLYAVVPAHCKYGMGGVGTYTTKRMGKILVPADQLGPIFQITPEGDSKMNHHITMCITTRADGAPGPFIIHAGGIKKKDEDCNEAGSLDDEFRFDPKYLAGLCNLDVDPNNPKEAHHSNPMNFDVRVTPNGSMDKQHFLDWSHHFVCNLPESQGKNKEPVFLTLDGHVSRSNLAAMRYLKENNVFVFFLLSHTSIWSQPNDCGVNLLRFHACVEQVAKQMRRGVSDAK
eukprot:scaffold91161_cov32-Attheya_sp.AAC.1